MTAFGQLQRPLDDSVGCRLNCLGNDAFLHVLAAVKAMKSDMVDRLEERDADILRTLLKKRIETSLSVS